MERKVISLIEEPRGPIYRAILDLGMHKCKAALLVVRSSITLKPSAETVLQRLRPFLLIESESSEWPGTILYDDRALVSQYALEQGCVAVLKEVADGLYDWQQPDLPEDLCLLRSDGTPWLVSIAHENDGYFEIAEDELAEMVNAIPDLAAILRHD